MKGYLGKPEQGRYGPIFPRLPRAMASPSSQRSSPAVRKPLQTAKHIEEAVAGLPDCLAVLKLHYLRWVLFDQSAGDLLHVSGHLRHGLRQIHRGRGGALLKPPASTPSSRTSRASPRTGRRTPGPSWSSSAKHHRPSFLEYGEYPYVSADEIKKALKLKAAFSGMLDLMQ